MKAAGWISMQTMPFDRHTNLCYDSQGGYATNKVDLNTGVEVRMRL